MKKIFPVQLQRSVFLLCAIAFTACKKTETITITMQKPVTKFAVYVPDPFYGAQFEGTSTYIDSNFYFRNLSDTGDAIKYRWEFGDGTTSTDKNPKHSYSRRGSYTVTLMASNNDRAFDTVKQQVSVILGQQHISFGDGNNIIPVATEETGNNDFVLLGAAGYGAGCFLFQLDSLLKQKSMKTFPSNYRFNSMKATGDGNYIFTGSTLATDKSNELVKMKADGTQLWNKVLSASDSYSYASPTADGGCAVVGTRPVPGLYGNIIYNTVVIKTDNTGNLQWQKLLDGEGMINTRDGVVETDGIVVAGTKRGNCTECDSIFVVKLNNSGSVVWKTAVFGGMNNFTWWDTRIAKLGNGNYAVTNGYTRGIFFFSPSGDFLDRKLAPSQVAGVTPASDGGLFVLQTESGNGFRIMVSKLNLDGVQQWSAYTNGSQKVANGVRCCSSSSPVAIQPLRNGGVLVTGYRIDDNATGYNYHYVTVLLELGENGKPK